MKTLRRTSYVGSVTEDRPRTIYFYATSHCNSNCSYCVFRKTNQDLARIHMPLKDIRRIWLESDILRSCGIVVQGGEFTIHPEAEQIMKFFHAFLPKVTLLTNAVDPQLAIPLIQYATQVTISLDGPLHDKSRGVIGNLLGVFELLEHLKKNKTETTLQITLGPWNARNIENGSHSVMWFLDTCMQFNAQPRFNVASDDGLLGIAHYEQRNEVLSEIAIGLLSLAKHIEYEPIAKSLKNGARYLNASVSKSTGTHIPCISTSIYSTIGADGSVWMCQGLNEEEAIVGNLMGDNTFDKIWESFADKRKEYRACQRCTLSCQLNGDLAYLAANTTNTNVSV